MNLNGIHHQSMMTTKWASSFFSSSLEEDAVKMMREKGRGDYVELRKKKGKRDKDWNGLKGDEGGKTKGIEPREGNVRGEVKRRCRGEVGCRTC